MPPLLARAGDLQSVGDLGTRGIRKVRLVSQSDLESAIRDAVSRELLDQLDGLDLTAEQRRRVEQRALARLSGDGPPPRPAVFPRSEGSEDHGATQPMTAFDFRAMEQRLVDEIGRLVAQNWREGLESSRDGQRDQIQRLERRIESLMRALDQVERMMDRGPAGSRAVAAAGALRPDAGPLGGIKNDLLEQLFQANLALRELEAGEERESGAAPGRARS